MKKPLLTRMTFYHGDGKRFGLDWWSKYRYVGKGISDKHMCINSYHVVVTAEFNRERACVGFVMPSELGGWNITFVHGPQSNRLHTITDIERFILSVIGEKRTVQHGGEDLYGYPGE